MTGGTLSRVLGMEGAEVHNDRLPSLGIPELANPSEVNSESPSEIRPLNRELMSFDLDAIAIEELERRFEMALVISPGAATTCNCPALVSCGTFCNKKPPV